MRRTSLLLAAATATLVSSPVLAQSRCGLTEEMQPGETIEELAERCGTEPDEILRVNDAETVAELPEGRLRMPIFDEQEVDDFLGRARDAIGEAGRRIEDAATSAGKSVSEYLSERPDLNRDIAEFGERLGLPGVTAEPSQGPDVIAERNEDGGLRVEAWGLPGDRPVDIVLRRDGKTELLRTADTDPAGRLIAEVDLPEAEPAGTAEIVVETEDGRMRLVSESITLD